MSAAFLVAVAVAACVLLATCALGEGARVEIKREGHGIVVEPHEPPASAPPRKEPPP